MPAIDNYREANRRRHKLLGMYLALWGWQHGVECVALQRDQLLDYLDLQIMQNDRLGRLKEDVFTFFAYSCDTMVSPDGKHATLYLSRKPIPDSAKQGVMKDNDRIKALRKAGLRSAIVRIPTEQRLVQMLASMAHGLGDLK